LNQEIVDLAKEIRMTVKPGQKIAFVSGNFNVVHAGHVRVLNFAAERADYLVVGIHPDGAPETFVPQELRLEGIKAIGSVDCALLLQMPLEEFITTLKPDFVIKGKERELQCNVEEGIVESYGGKLIFASGETWFSYLNHLEHDLRKTALPSIDKPTAYMQRHVTDTNKLCHIVNRFSDLRVAVLGDLIVDEYVFCDPLGISQEDPTIVVTPIKRERFVGGAGIVAAHASSLGAQVHYFSVAGDDPIAEYALAQLGKYKVNACLISDETRPTTLKQRYRAQGKTLLRVSELRQHSISIEIQKKLVAAFMDAIDTFDLLVFSDFSYGCLPQPLIDQIFQLCSQKKIPMVADSQSSSQMGDISRFKQMLLITPTEREARLAIRDSHSGLLTVADKLLQETDATHVFITLGSEGLLIYSPHGPTGQIYTDELPAFNSNPKDLAGAGDCMLISSALSLVAGANVWESAYIGSVAAACQVSRIGNLPLGIEDLKKELTV